MISRTTKNFIQWTLLTATVSVALFITPSFSYEPVDLPKMFLLLTFGISLLGHAPKLKHFYLNRKYSLINIALLFFNIQLILVVFFSKSPFNQQFYGTFGRNTGFLTYVTLASIAISTIAVSEIKFLSRLNIALFTTGIITTLYGYLQLTKHDPIKWNNPYNPIIGFLGNPDFSSAFLGMSSIVGIAYVLKRETKPLTRISILIYEIFTFFLILKTHAQQGVLVFGIGTTFIIYNFLWKNPRTSKIWSKLFGFVSIAIGGIAILGILKIGPLASHLYKLSVRQRGFYWHAAIRMMNSHPIFGVGLDSYGDNYLTYRSANAAFHTQLTQSNAAHNVFLDFGASGGYPLFLIYLAITFYTFWCGINVIRRSESFNAIFVAIFAAWLGYTAQSIVSINQIGLAVWGWALIGAIIGFYKSESISQVETESKNLRNLKRKNVGNFNWASIGLATSIGFAVGVLPFAADHNFREASLSRNANQIISEVNSYPEDETRKINTAQLLAGSNLKSQAIFILKNVVSENPKNYNAWNLLYVITDHSSPDYGAAYRKIKELNPYYQPTK
jgi:O-antigen ligase